MATSREEQIREYGWAAVSCDPKQWGGLKKYNNIPKPLSITDITIPDTPLAKSIMNYAKKELPEPTFNHSMRVFYYGLSIQTMTIPIRRSRSQLN
jgi:cyanamide hydratase